MAARSACSFLIVLALLAGGGTEYARAVQPATGLPNAQASASASATPLTFSILPAGTDLTLLLDHDVSSANVKAGYWTTLHLKSPLVLNGITLADDKTQIILRVISAQHAATGQVDGSMQVSLDPLPIAGGAELPIRLARSLIAVSHSAGERSTSDLTDTATMVIFPAALLLRAIQKGQDATLSAGTPIRVYTISAVSAKDQAHIVVQTPRPLIVNDDPVHAEYTAPPLFGPTPRASPTPSPRPSPSVTQSPK